MTKAKPKTAKTPMPEIAPIPVEEVVLGIKGFDNDMK